MYSGILWLIFYSFSNNIFVRNANCNQMDIMHAEDVILLESLVSSKKEEIIYLCRNLKYGYSLKDIIEVINSFIDIKDIELLKKVFALYNYILVNFISGENDAGIKYNIKINTIFLVEEELRLEAYVRHPKLHIIQRIKLIFFEFHRNQVSEVELMNKKLTDFAQDVKLKYKFILGYGESSLLTFDFQLSEIKENPNDIQKLKMQMKNVKDLFMNKYNSLLILIRDFKKNHIKLYLKNQTEKIEDDIKACNEESEILEEKYNQEENQEKKVQILIDHYRLYLKSEMCLLFEEIHTELEIFQQNIVRKEVMMKRKVKEIKKHIELRIEN